MVNNKQKNEKNHTLDNNLIVNTEMHFNMLFLSAQWQHTKAQVSKRMGRQ
jgi:hypothetical protein